MIHQFYQQLSITNSLIQDHQLCCENILSKPVLKRQHALGVTGEDPFVCLSEHTFIRLSRLTDVSLNNIMDIFPRYRYCLSNFLNAWWERVEGIEQMGDGLRLDNTLRTLFEKLQIDGWIYHDDIVILLLWLSKHLPSEDRIHIGFHLDTLDNTRKTREQLTRYLKTNYVIQSIFYPPLDDNTIGEIALSTCTLCFQETRMTSDIGLDIFSHWMYT